MSAFPLTVVDGCLYADASMLMCMYDAGDVDTCPWPMAGGADLRGRLAKACFDERECGEIPTSCNGRVRLPDGEIFDFDDELMKWELANPQRYEW